MGLVGPKARLKGVTDGQQVNIPALQEDRQRVIVEILVSLCLHHSVLEKKPNSKNRVKAARAATRLYGPNTR